ncbi:hypothetical protein AB4Y30_10530 [Ornithinibacillus sp. 4-3]|uniref:Sporulation lipoprotein YhcN/YlaJ (Spore_YhcN_YlaJ) n=1 Tax=Ornithinibacillus sp. 4-3 TaxID=3231488 RepID=A0AB39HHC6_9BACI
MRYIIMFLCVLFLITGCTSLNARKSEEMNIGQLESDDSSPHYQRTEREKREVDENPTKDYYQSDEEGIGKDGNERNFFAEKDSLLITQFLAQKKEVKDVQVDSYENMLVVYLQLRHDLSQEEIDKIGNEIVAFAPDKEVVLYTDEQTWSRKEEEKAKEPQRR